MQTRGGREEKGDERGGGEKWKQNLTKRRIKWKFWEGVIDGINLKLSSSAKQARNNKGKNRNKYNIRQFCQQCIGEAEKPIRQYFSYFKFLKLKKTPEYKLLGWVRMVHRSAWRRTPGPHWYCWIYSATPENYRRFVQW